MGKGKYKRQQKRAQEKAQKGTTNTAIVEKEEMSENKTEPGAKSSNKSTHDKNPSLWQRFIKYVGEKSSFTDWLIVVFTSALTGAAIYQFIIMGGQLDVMRIDQRAWISVKHSGITSTDNRPSGNILITNTGKTPAANISGHFYIEVIPNGKTPHFENEAMHTVFSIGNMVPNDSHDIPVIRGKAGENDILTKDERADLDNGKAWMVMHGVVKYQDIFKVNHWAKFCTWTSFKHGEYPATSCTQYNSIDDK